MRPFIYFNLFMLLFAGTITGCRKEQKDKPVVDPVIENAGYMPEIKGMKLTYTITKGDEMGESYIQTVKDVHDSSGYIVATLVADISGIVINSQVMHNEKNTVTIDGPPPVYYQLLDQIKNGYTEFTHEENYLNMVIPHQNQLKAIVFTETVVAKWHGVNDDPEGETTTVMDYNQTEHQGIIDTIEKVKIHSGEFECLRIHWLRTTSEKVTITDQSGTNTIESGNQFDETVWVTKGIGIIKSREVNLKTGIFSETELTKIEK